MTLINQNDPQYDGLFAHTQGNILKGHGREHTANIFIACDEGKQVAVKEWIKSLVARGIIHSTKKQLSDTAHFKETGASGGMFGTILFSAKGYEYLGFETKNKFADNFRGGMKKAELNDPDPSAWEHGFRKDIHFLLLIGDEDKAGVFAAAENFRKEIELFGAVTNIEYGNALRNTPQPGEQKGAGIEHFGYVDGTSQPLFFEDEIEKYKADNFIESDDFLYNPASDKSLILVKDPLSGASDAFGSYFVFRKLEQNVRGFKESEEELAAQLNLEGDDRERAGAMVVGRFEDGTPVEVQGTDKLPKSAVRNNFDYRKDEHSKCPYHAHIRKSNPRSANPHEDLASTQSHVMARRGIPFGFRDDGPNDGFIDNKPTGGVGLLFMSYQASLAQQFEFIQKNWVNKRNFPFDDSGLDPVIGQHQGNNISTGEFAVVYGDKTTLESRSFEHFLTMRGGEYFFAPSVSFLQQLG